MAKGTGISEQEMIDLLHVARMLGEREKLSYWPPETLRGTVRPCSEHGTLHWHFEAVLRLPGGLVAHVHDPEPWPKERVAKTMLGKFAQAVGVPLQYYSHEEFVHSGRPELEGDG